MAKPGGGCLETLVCLAGLRVWPRPLDFVPINEKTVAERVEKDRTGSGPGS